MNWLAGFLPSTFQLGPPELESPLQDPQKINQKKTGKPLAMTCYQCDEARKTRFVFRQKMCQRWVQDDVDGFLI